MKQYSNLRPTDKLFGLEIKKNELIGIDDKVVYGLVDDYPFEWHFYSKKNGRTEDAHFEQVDRVELHNGIVTVTFATGRKPLVFTKGRVIKDPAPVKEPESVPDQDDEPMPAFDDPVEEPQPMPALKKADYMPVLGAGLSFEQVNKTFKNQLDLIDRDGYSYAVMSQYDHVIHFSKWNGFYPQHGKIVTKIENIKSISLTNDPERTVKVSYFEGFDGYFLGNIPDPAPLIEDVGESPKLHYPPRRIDVDTVLKAYFKGRIVLRDFVPSLLINGEWIEYVQSNHLRALLSESDEAIRLTYQAILTQDTKYNYQIPKTEFTDILNMLFNQEHQDTFMEWIKSVPWDGIDRKSTLHKAIGLSTIPYNDKPIVDDDDDDLYCRALIHMILVGAIQRHIKPFIQDFVPVIVGLPNAGKSTTLRALANCFDDDNQGWYCGKKGKVNIDNEGREFYRPQLGRAIVELIEIDSMLKKDETGFIKAFLDSSHARFNEKHEKGMKKYPLTAFVTGTTNHERFLVDYTGNRRFIVVYMRQMNDTPNRESLKNVDNFRYTNDPLYLKFHPEYVQQLYAQAYEEYLNGELYDFYVDRNDPANVIIKVQNKLNLHSLKYPENMDVFLGFMRSRCDEVYSKVCKWTDIKRDFALEYSNIMTKFQIDAIYKCFKENPKNFGFSDYDLFRISKDSNPVWGYKLIDPDVCELFTMNYSEIEE